MKKIVVYDLETLINLFTACFYDIDTGKKKEFVLFNGIEEFRKMCVFLERLAKHGYTMLGFNNVNFDAQLIQFLLANYKQWLSMGYTVEYIVHNCLYNKAQDIINLPEDERWEVLIPEYKLWIPQIDLFKQKHYDCKAKMGTSLKWIQFTTRYKNIEEMPIKHDTYITEDMISGILEYNWNDVMSTYDFYEKIKFETELRVVLSEKYNKNLLNASEPRLAKEILGKFLSESMKISMADLKKMRTFRKEIPVNRILFPYIKFETPELQAVHNAFKQLIINPNEKQTFDYCFKYHNIDMVLGLGGIHACCSPGVYTKAPGHNLLDIDVVSFYPNLSIQNGLKPKHLGDIFLKIYDNIFQERKKIPKADPINYVYKIILNAAYGLSKEKNSFLYDPAFTFGITINGQLSLLMLIEMLVTRIPNIKLLQANTDGVTFDYEEHHLPQIKAICKEWEAITKLDLEEATYKSMVIKDVNNYIGIYDNPDKEAKKKGMFETKLDYHKNPSFLVVPKALEAYFVKGQDYKQYVYSHKDIFDFFGAVKKKSNFNLNLYKLVDGGLVRESQQKVTRFYVSKEGGGQLFKEFTDNRKVNKTSIIAGYKVYPMNRVTIDDAHDPFYNIDYRTTGRLTRPQ